MNTTHRPRRPLVLVLSGALVIVAVVLIVIRTSDTGRDTTTTRHAAPHPPTVSGPAAAGGYRWDTDAENALSTRPMPSIPPAAAQPQPVVTEVAGPPIGLPPPAGVTADSVGTGFPATPEGALAQLAAADRVGLAGGDPDVYARVYRELSLPGAPTPASTGLNALLTSVRAYAGLSATGPVDGFLASYQPTHGLIKGSTDGGRFVVVCVLGEFSVQYQAQTDDVGIGDCQAMRWTDTTWRISPTRLAAAAPCAWPGSAAAVAAGYRELR